MQENSTSARMPRLRWRRAKVLAGALALTSGVFAAGLTATVGTASAATTFPPVVTKAYTITPSTAKVQNVSLSVSPTSFGATGNYVAMFTTPVALVSGDSITISTVNAASAAGYAWTKVANVGIVDVTAGNTFGAQSVATSSVTGQGTSSITIALPASGINAGDTVEVTFQATNPTTDAGGPYTYDIFTNVSPTPAPTSTSSAVTFGPLALAVSASNQEIGAVATYTFTNLTANASTADTTIELTASGSVVFSSAPGSYTVTDTNTGATDSVTGVAPPSGSTTVTNDVVLSLASALAANDSYTVTAIGTNPTSAQVDTFAAILAGTKQNEQASSPIGFGLAVGNVTVTPSPATAGVSSTYTVGFASTDGLNPGGSITVTGPSGTNFTNAAALVTDTTTGAFQVVTGTISSSGNQISLSVPGLTIAKGNLVTVTLYGVTNPKAGSYVGSGGLEVTTTNDPLASYNSTPYVIAAAAPSNVLSPSVTVSSNSPSVVATYTIAPFVAVSNLVAGTDTIELQAPSGTVLPGSGYTLTDSTTATGTQSLTVKSLSDSDSDVVLNLSNNIKAGDVLSLSIVGVVNPSTGSTTDTITLGADSVATNATATGTQGLGTETVLPNAATSYPNGAIVNFSGTDYVFAGGMAFAATTSELAGVQKVDHATVITAPSGAVPPTTSAPVTGTMVKVFNNATIYVVSNGDLYGFASPGQMMSLGYDPAFNVTVPSLGSLTVATETAGKADVTALDTLATGALVNTSPTIYVLGGGHAFGIPGPKALATVQKADPATVLKGSLPSTTMADTITNGTLVTVSPPAGIKGASTVYAGFNNELYGFVSPTQLANAGYGGTASLTVTNTGGLTIAPRP